MAVYTVKELNEKITMLAEMAKNSTIIDNSYYAKYDVKRGLRDISGKGVVCGLTEISEIISSKENEDGTSSPAEGELYYRGYNIKDLIRGIVEEDRFGFEEITYLLLFGELPSKEELCDFCEILAELRTLPRYFVRDVIMKAPSTDMMNTLSRGVLSLYPYDDKADDISIPNVLRQQLQMIAQFPLLAVYGYNTFRHYHGGESLIIHKPHRKYSTAENILHMLRDDSNFTKLEAKLLDICLILHAEHGGGNNSSFTTHVVSSSGTDSYSAIAASLGSLKGPRHGGANIKVSLMFEDLKKTVKNLTEENVRQYLCDLLDKKAFDGAGLIYGMGHAVYSISDPRCEILKGFVKQLAVEKGKEKEYELYAMVERLAPEVIAEKRKIYKGVSANIDFYSGFVYSLLGLPKELYTPFFAMARIVGWSAHRIEELSNAGKIIRPGYISVAKRRNYIKIDERENEESNLINVL